MADWTSIPDTTFEPGAPAKGRDMRFLRDNPIAIAEGAPGAPRIDGTQSPALRNGGVPNGELGAEKLQTGTAERDWVLARTSQAALGVVGSYAFLAVDGSKTEFYAPGSLVPGSSTQYAGLNANPGAYDTARVTATGSPPGTWRIMGYTGTSLSKDRRLSVFLRVA